MSLPMRVLEEKGTMRAETSIDVRGRCSKDHLTEAHLIVGVTVDHQIHREGDKLSAQQRKMGIAAIQEMYTMALKFLGHEVATDLLPGMVVRVSSPVREQSNKPPQYIGVVEWIRDGQMLLRTLHHDATERLVRIAPQHYDVQQDPSYMGIEGLKQLVHAGGNLSDNLVHARCVLVQAANAARRDEQASVEVDGRAFADAAAIASIRDGEGLFTAPKVPVEQALGFLIGEAVKSCATAISLEHDGDQLRILIHASGQKLPHASRGCRSEDLYDHVKRITGMNLQSRDVQNGRFNACFLSRHVMCLVETFFRNDGPAEGLVIALAY